MPGKEYETLFDIAMDQYGYVTASQAAARGVRTNTMTMMTRRGAIDGWYEWTPQPHDEYAKYADRGV